MPLQIPVNRLYRRFVQSSQTSASTPATGVQAAAQPTDAAQPGKAPAPQDFSFELTGCKTPVAGGNFITQMRQGWKTSKFAMEAVRSIATRHQTPSDAEVKRYLAKVSKTPVIGGEKKTSVATYRSTVANTTGEELYRLFVKDPNEVFRGTTLALRPAVTELKDGMRLMMEDQAIPPLWLPVEVKLEPAKNTVTFHTMDGHALRGTNAFTFTTLPDGSTEVLQVSRFQGSSQLTTVGTSLLDALDHQHSFWESVHARFDEIVAPLDEEEAFARAS